MAFSRGTIEMNFRQARAQAEKLEGIAGRLTNLITSEYAGAMQGISANWKGENADAYLKKGATLQEDMEQTAEALRGVAGEIRATAQRIYDAEMAAVAIVERRSYF